MESDSFESLSFEELVIIETRIKHSVDNLKALVNELKTENERLFLNNSHLKNSIKQSKNKKFNKFESLIMHTLGVRNLCSSDGILKESQIHDNKIMRSKNFQNFKKYSFNLKSSHKIDGTPNILESKIRPTEDTSIVETAKNSQLSNFNSKVLSNESLSLYDLNVESNLETNSHICIKRPEYIFKYGDSPSFKVKLLLDNGEFAEIKFCKFEEDSERSNFVKKLIKSIGLKSIYFNCINNLLKRIEIGHNVEFTVDIATLDPWEGSSMQDNF